MNFFNPQNNDPNNTNRLLFFSSGVVVFLMVWSFIFPPKVQQNQVKQEEALHNVGDKKLKDAKKDIKLQKILPVEDLLTSSKNLRVKFENSEVFGSVNLLGGLMDDLILKKHQHQSRPIRIMHPKGSLEGVYIANGWLNVGDCKIQLPEGKTIWHQRKAKQDGTISIFTNNGTGQEFILQFTPIDDYSIRVQQTVRNNGKTSINVKPFLLLKESHDSGHKTTRESYEGMLGFFGNRFREVKQKDILKEKAFFAEEQNVWGGYSNKYWLTAIVPAPQNKVSVLFKGSSRDIQVNNLGEKAKMTGDRNQTTTKTIGSSRMIMNGESVEVRPLQSYTFESVVFAGPKELEMMRRHSIGTGTSKSDVASWKGKLFIRGIDLGAFYFLTEPLILMLHTINKAVPPHNFGISIVILTIVIRLLLVLPSKGSYASMAKMRMVEPKIKEIRDRYADNKEQANLAIIELYKKEKINPIASVVPLLFQIPIFVGLYRILSVDIALRSAVFIPGWIDDLSIADPTSIFNLFGLLPIVLPSFLQHVGILPIIMGGTMFLQQLFSGATKTSPEQAIVMQLLPVFLTFLFAGLPSGLLIYWSASNLFSIFQQIAMAKFFKPKIKTK